MARSEAYQVVADFEMRMADYAHAPFAVAVNSCTSALFLCYKFRAVHNLVYIDIPRVTYPSVAMQAYHAGATIRWTDDDWQSRGWYDIAPAQIIDSAKRLARGMYQPGYLICLSFHAKKSLPIGHGGMILTDDREANRWLRIARFDGRHERSLHEDNLAFPGWNCYMAPEQAARGLELAQWLPDEVMLPPDPYQDLSTYRWWRAVK